VTGEGSTPFVALRSRRSSHGLPRPYDFRRSTKLSRKHVRSLELLFEAFARQWAALLTAGLRSLTTVSVASIEELTYDEYVARLNSPTMVNVVRLHPLPGVGFLEWSMTSAMVCVERLLGGPGTGPQPQRPLTDIEAGLLGRLVARVLDELRTVFEPMAPMAPEVTGVEYNPAFMQAAQAGDVLIVAGFALRIGEVESTATVALPFAGIFPLLEVAVGGQPDSPGPAAAPALRVTDRLVAVPVDVAVAFAPTPLTPPAVAGLAVGDVIRLAHPVTAPLRITAADVVFAHAVPGRRGRMLAARVVDSPVAREEER
jgi:flagellar motor switch protein FliM